MLPPGHIAGGYLAAYALLKLTHVNLPPEQINLLLGLGAVFGFAPDLDMFRAFAKVKSFTIQEGRVSHRKFFTHAPLIWAAVGIGLIFLAFIAQSPSLNYSFANNFSAEQLPFIKYIGLIIWLGSWSHFALDSIEHGVPWLWPLVSRLFALKDAGQTESISEPRFWAFWWKFFRFYTTHISFYLEIVVIAAGLIIFLTSS